MVAEADPSYLLSPGSQRMSSSTIETRTRKPVQAGTRVLFNDQDSDVILRSSDGIDLLVLKTALRLASPVFNTMFSLPWPPRDIGKDDDDCSTMTVIPVDEPIATLEPLLQFCYPVKASDLSQKTLTVILSVLSAARKYEIGVAIERARDVFEKRVCRSVEDAIAGYASACHLKLEEQARIAARACLKGPIHGVEMIELGLMSGSDYFNLLRYHELACGKVALLLETHSYMKTVCEGIIPPDHYCAAVKISISFMNGNGWSSDHVYHWWTNWNTMMVAAVKQAPLAPDVFSLSELACYLQGHECSECKSRVLKGWERTSKAIGIAINRVVDQVVLKVSWN